MIFGNAEYTFDASEVADADHLLKKPDPA